ncbi:MAG: tyrosine-type recombinase/integrase, partial [Terriglobia bacterium]
YSSDTITRRIPLLVSFGDFARDRGATTWADLPAQVESFVSSWLQDREQSPKFSPERNQKFAQELQNPILQMLRLILPELVGPRRPAKPENPFQQFAPEFFVYLRQEKGLREPTIKLYAHALRQFASYLGSIGLTDLSQLSPPVLSGFVTDLNQKVGRASTRDTCGRVRVLLRYLFRQRVLPRDLSSVVENPHAYRLSNIPRSITWDEVRRMLETVDQRTPRGKRDYAILLLLVTYGLRAREVAALTLDDVDWKNDRLKIPDRKADHSTIYPLSPIVGQAILDCLKFARPETTDRHLFFRTMAPRNPLTYEAISSTASHYLHKAGIAVARPGSHTLRHTCVQRLVEADFSLKLIGDYVGHRSPASTEIYSKVDIEALREVACGDGEEVL